MSEHESPVAQPDGQVIGAPPPPPSEKKSFSDVDPATLVASGLTLLTAATGVVGSLNGSLARFLRNDYKEFVAALIATGVALTSAFVLAYFHNKPGRVWKPAATFVTFVAFVVAVGLVITGSSDALKRPDIPRIEVSWAANGNQEVANVMVDISGLKATDVLYVVVRPSAPLNPTKSGTTLTGELGDQVIYNSLTGTDADGSADLSFQAPLPSGWGAVQIVASIGQVSDCAGDPIVSQVATTTPDPPPTPTITPTSSGGSGGSGGASPAPPPKSPIPSGKATISLAPQPASNVDHACVTAEAPAGATVSAAPVPAPVASTSPAGSPSPSH